MKVSIITITYNSARTLLRALRSVNRQDYPDIEHIIVDGESVDATLSIIKEYSSQYSNIRYISQPDNGIYDAINKGIQMATGDIIGLLNSDDELATTNAISEIAKTFEQTQADIVYGDLVYCRYDAIEHNPPRVVRYWKSNDFNKRDLRLGWMPAHPTLYCKKEVFEEVGLYRPEFRISADYEFILRTFLPSSFHKVYIPNVLVKMEVGGISNRNLRSIILKTKEDIQAMRLHQLPACITIICKNLRKFRQFFRR